MIQKKKWGKIAEYLRVARGTHASGNKLDDIYVKWLLPYDTLSSVEREELIRLGKIKFYLSDRLDRLHCPDRDVLLWTNTFLNKLDDIYVMCFLPYDTLFSMEREELIAADFCLVEEEAVQSKDRA